MLTEHRHLANDVDNFPRNIQKLLDYFNDIKPRQPVQALPSQEFHMLIWLLDSRLYSAQLAAAMSLPFPFASHFVPEIFRQALSLHRNHFTPSLTLSQTYAMVFINVIAADRECDARFLFTSMQQQFINL